MKIQNTERKMIKVRSVQAASVYRVANGYKFLSKINQTRKIKMNMLIRSLIIKQQLLMRAFFQSMPESMV